MNTQKPLFFLLVIFFCRYNSTAQDAIQNKLSPEEYKPSVIELKKFSSSPHKFIFIDERDDTTRMGFFVGQGLKQYYFTFPKPATIYLSEKTTNKKGEIPIDTLYIGIKRLWISQVNTPPSLLRAFLLNSNKTIGYCHIVCNFYRKDENKYSLIHQYDSIVSKNGYLGNIKDNLIEENLSLMKLIADNINPDSVNNISAIFETEYPGAKAIKPVLSAEKPNDGIYLTFHDFVNNHPVDLDFTYSVSKTGEELILKEKSSNDSVYTEQCWGFCKNNAPYMRIGARFSKLTKIQNTYELRIAESLPNRYSKEFDAFWLGFNVSSHLSSGFPIFALSDIISHKKSPETILRVSPFKLDMETGNVY